VQYCLLYSTLPTVLYVVLTVSLYADVYLCESGILALFALHVVHILDMGFTAEMHDEWLLLLVTNAKLVPFSCSYYYYYYLFFLCRFWTRG